MINEIHVLPSRELLDLPQAWLEVIKPVKELRSRKAPGPDMVPFDLFVGGNLDMHVDLDHLILKIWQKKTSQNARKMQLPWQLTKIRVTEQSAVTIVGSLWRPKYSPRCYRKDWLNLYLRISCLGHIVRVPSAQINGRCDNCRKAFEGDVQKET